MKTQLQRILSSSAPEITVAGRKYKGRPQAFAPTFDPITKAHTGFKKISAGIPFVRI